VKIIRPLGAYLIHADSKTDKQQERERDGQTDITKLVIYFRNFAKASESTIQLQEKSRLKLIENKFLSETLGVKITK